MRDDPHKRPCIVFQSPNINKDIRSVLKQKNVSHQNLFYNAYFKKIISIDNKFPVV